MNSRRARVRLLGATAAATGAVVLAPNAWPHPHVQPTEVLAKQGNLFALTVPTEEQGVTTTTVELRPPEGFSIGAFAPSPGWTRRIETTGSGENARIAKVTWSGGSVPTDQSAFFVFTGQADAEGAADFAVRQTYSNGELVDWSGPESSDTPAPVVDAKSSLGGGGTSVLGIVALVVGGAALLLAALALVTRGGTRELA